MLIYVSCLVLAGAYPLAVYADESTPGALVPEVVVPGPQPEVTPTPQPEATVPTTKAPEPPAPKKTYTYDAASSRWNSNQWAYDAATNAYIPAAVTPAPQVASTTDLVPAEAQQSSASIVASDTKSEIANALQSLAASGNATVNGNGLAGNAASGNASAAATIINNVNSSMSNTSNKEAASFVTNVMGDVNGDIMLQPILLKAMLEAAIDPSQGVNVNNSTSIANDVRLTATSGDASVTKNTQAGDAATGAANTVVDVVNLVNSMISSNQSFTGTVNIYGNLNGDILIAPDFIPQMLSSNKASDAPSSPTVVNASDTQAIVNNVSLAAKSGASLVTGNTSAGNAKTGESMTNLVLFNLSGHDIVASNSLLVFINVLGKWVGVIVDAPVGATAAAIGDDVTKNDKQSPSLVLDATNETVITNNINASSRSGDAIITGNTKAGSAQSGNATASANIANISNSSLGMTGWFGVLFINVFGSWLGSFGIDTEAGGSRAVGPEDSSIDDNESAPSERQRVIRFIPRAERPQRSVLQIVNPTASQEKSSQATFASSTERNGEVKGAVSDIPSQDAIVAERKHNQALQLPIVIGSLVLIGASLYGLRRYLF